jgi:hypothetical protein
MKNYKTEPFDLEKALAGHTLVDGQGCIYTGFRKSKTNLCHCYASTDSNGDTFFFDKDGQFHNQPCVYDLSLYIPLTSKELALQALDEALQACEAAVDVAHRSSPNFDNDMYYIRRHITACKDIISLLHEPT